MDNAGEFLIHYVIKAKYPTSKYNVMILFKQCFKHNVISTDVERHGG